MSTSFYWSPQGSVTSIHQVWPFWLHVLPLLWGISAGLHQTSQNSNKFVHVREIPNVLSAAEKRASQAWFGPGQVWTEICHLCSVSNKCVIKSNAKEQMRGTAPSILQLPTFISSWEWEVAWSTRSFSKSETSVIENVYIQLTPVQLIRENRWILKTW